MSPLEPSDSRNSDSESDYNYCRRRHRQERYSRCYQEPYRTEYNKRPVSSPDRDRDYWHSKHIWPEDVKYKGNKVILVTLYINCLQNLVQSYRETAVLKAIPRAITGKVQTWLDSLLQKTMYRMNYSLEVWYKQLCLRWTCNTSQAIGEADRMQHTFATKKETNLDVCQYLTKKLSLYCKAGKENEDLVV